MLFAPLAVAMACSMGSMMVATNPTRRRSAPAPAAGGDGLPFDANNEFIDPTTGLINSWRGASSEDTIMLKQIIEGGFITNYTTKQVKDEYGRYRRFTNKCLGDKISNLRRTHRNELERRADMNAANGGGQGLQARQPPSTAASRARAPSTAPPTMDPFQERYGCDIYDEADDDDYEYLDDVEENMSRMTLDEDDLSFASQSVTFRSHAGRSVAGRSFGGGRSVSGVSFAGDVSVASAAPRPQRGILRNSSSRGGGASSSSAPRRSSLSSRNRRGSSSTSTTCGSSNEGGLCVKWIVDCWQDKTTGKRSSVQVHVPSGDSQEDSITIRVSSDQHHLVLSKPKPESFTDAKVALSYVFPRVKQAYNYIDNQKKMWEQLENHPRVVARLKTIKRLKAASPSSDVLCDEVRIPLGIKAQFELVTPEEDPVFYGQEFYTTVEGEVYIYLECKSVRKDSFGADAKRFIPSSNRARVGGMSAIPEEVSIGSNYSDHSYVHGGRRGGSRTGGRSARSSGSIASMDVDDSTVYGTPTTVNSDDSDSHFTFHLREVEAEMERDIAEGIARTSGNPPTSPTGTEYTEETYLSAKESPKKKQRLPAVTEESPAQGSPAKSPVARVTPVAASTKKSPAKKATSVKKKAASSGSSSVKTAPNPNSPIRRTKRKNAGNLLKKAVGGLKTTGLDDDENKSV